MEPRKSNSTCEEGTYQSLYQQFARSLRNFLYYQSGNDQLAEDLTQEAFLKLWLNCAKVPPEKAKSFIYTVGSNLFKNEMAHGKVKLKYQQRKVTTEAPKDPEFLYEENEFKQQLLQSIQALPPKQRVVFLLNRIDKKTYREIAEMLSISQKAVEKRMSQALVKLRELNKRI